MSVKSHSGAYGSVAKTFHWLTALLFLLAYISVYYRHWFTEQGAPDNWIALQLHLSIGILIAVVVILRIIWRIFDETPEQAPGSKFKHRAARWFHGRLYRIMLLAPLTGYLGTSVDTEFFFLFDIPKFENTMLYQFLVTDVLQKTFEEFERPIDFIHKQVLGAWLIWILIMGHAGAALYHHFIRNDNTLRKMTTLR